MQKEAKRGKKRRSHPRCGLPRRSLGRSRCGRILPRQNKKDFVQAVSREWRMERKEWIKFKEMLIE
jgi:hypothetical protein